MKSLALSSTELFSKACRGEKSSRPPAWMMRQAGRYLPEYRAIRERVSFLELCRTPELAAAVSLQPLDIIGVDAVIVFSDILLPLADFGMEIDFPEGGGITVRHDSRKDYSKFTIGENVGATLAAIGLIGEELVSRNVSVPILGFAGAPWTLANYILEGGTARKGKDFSKAKEMAWSRPKEMHGFLGMLADMTATYLTVQIEAGADFVQLFDTWAGELSPEDFMEFAAPYQARVLAQLPSGDAYSTALYAKGISPHLPTVAGLGFDVLSVDWKVSLSEAWRIVSQTEGNTIKCLQGNLDPLKLLLPPEEVAGHTERLIREGEALDCGHILNLGHGITPQARVDSARAFITTAKEWA